MLRRRYFVLQVKCHSLIDRMQRNYNSSGTCLGSDRFRVSKRSHEQKARCFEEGTSYYK
jgi:hypothetical protein